MVILLLILLAVVPFVLGTTVNHICGEKGTDNTFVYLVGVLFLFCVSQLVLLPGVKFGISLQTTAYGWAGTLMVLCIVSGVLNRRELRERLLKVRPLLKNPLWIALLIILVLLAGSILYYQPVDHEDMTMETIQTTLATNTLYQFNPATGQAFAVGMTVRGKLVTLPLFYAMLLKVLPVSIPLFLYGIMPIWFLLVSFMAYARVADVLLCTASAKENKRDSQIRNKKIIFVIIYGVLLIFGDYIFATSNFRILHLGAQGETILVSVVMPLFVALCLNWRLKREQMRSQVAGVFLCIVMATAIADMGISFLFLGITAVLFLIIAGIRKGWEVFVCRKHGV